MFKLHQAAVARNASPTRPRPSCTTAFLPLAINPPYDQKQIAIDYADLLRGAGQVPAEAVKYYGMVAPADAGTTTRPPRFGTLLTLYAALGDDQPVPAGRPEEADWPSSCSGGRATSTKLATAAAAASAKTDADRNQRPGPGGHRPVRRRHQRPPRPEGPGQGAPTVARRLRGHGSSRPVQRQVVRPGGAVQQRVNAYMDQGKTPTRPRQLVKLLKPTTRPPARG